MIPDRCAEMLAWKGRDLPAFVRISLFKHEKNGIILKVREKSNLELRLPSELCAKSLDLEDYRQDKPGKRIMNIIGRKREMQILEDCVSSGRPEFLVLYGRRRVGKTYLIRQFFGERFSFYATGVAKADKRDQLRMFHDSLKQYGCSEKKRPADWLEAFSRLRQLLASGKVPKDPVSGKMVVFLDELPWMDTPKSDFRSALDYFWNSWGSSQQNLLLIACGSATSWIMNHLLDDSGGFYNRITRQIHLRPFTLKECEDLLASNGMAMGRKGVMSCYMVFGGIPFYLNCLNRRFSLAQNIDELCFSEYGQLRNEYERLMNSLFRNSEKHVAIIEALSRRKTGMQRTELAEIAAIGDGEPLTKALRELEQCGFIRKYRNYSVQKQKHFFQLIDPFVLFSLQFIREEKINSWAAFVNSPGYYAWRGNAFEMVCLHHIPQMKQALGILGVESMEYAWRSRKKASGAQIDLLIDRRDDVINLCEMKYTNGEFVIDDAYEKQLINKLEVFREETGTGKSIHMTMVTGEGLKMNQHAGVIQNVIAGEDLFS